MYQQQVEYGVYDPTMNQWQNDPYTGQASQRPDQGAVAHSAWHSRVTYPSADATYLDSYGNPVSPSSERYYSPSSGYDSSSVLPPMTSQRPPSTRSNPQSHSRTQRINTPSPPQLEKDEDPAIEVLTRRAPFKRMFGYAEKQHGGSIPVYELADEVAAIAFANANSGIDIGIHRPNLARDDVQGSTTEERHGCIFQLTLFRMLSIAFPFVFLIPQVVVTSQGINLASGMLELFGGVVGIM